MNSWVTPSCYPIPTYLGGHYLCIYLWSVYMYIYVYI